MKKLLSFWSGRLLLMLFPAALVASFLVPADALAKRVMSGGCGYRGGSEGDPLDNNDYGGGGSGGGDVHNTGAPAPDSSSYILELQRFQILLIPEYVGGTLTFRIMVVDKADQGHVRRTLEGTHAP